jgi:hypothetical protein
MGTYQDLVSFNNEKSYILQDEYLQNNLFFNYNACQQLLEKRRFKTNQNGNWLWNWNAL